MKEYLTIEQEAEPAVAVYEEKRSKFIASLVRARSEEAAREFVAAARKKYFDARHNPYAYIAGGKEKSNDDGEPGGTAGSPILAALKGRNLSEAALVVTRYFGGIKLGAAGLYRAYGKAAAMAVEAAQIVRVQELAAFSVEVEYSLLDAVERYGRQKGLTATDALYADKVKLTFAAKEEDLPAIKADIGNITAGGAVIRTGGVITREAAAEK